MSELISKKDIRSYILAMRKSYDTNFLNSLSKTICNKVIKQDIYKSCKNIVLYMPINNEVNLDIIMADAQNAGKNIFLPKIINKNMDFYRYRENVQLIPGAYGILEPISNVMLIPDQETLIIIPGAAFSKDMGRIGYGGGYYDRYLLKNSICKTIAVCYDFQIMPYIPMDEHDIKPDMIISENNIFKAKEL